ncbi:MAG TPA: PilZ domain-containing protein [Candidatus Methylomirabilis sp.]|nr:PilZ domain-containing protein [Candidatus Methylomirabilis sp.]
MAAKWEERRFTRYQMALPLRYRGVDPPAAAVPAGWTRDLGSGGACIELDERIPAQGVLRLRFQTEEGTIESDARVIWDRQPPLPESGCLHGVAFTQLAPDQLASLRTLLLAQKPWLPARGRLPANLLVVCRPTRPARPPLRGQIGNLSRGGFSLLLPKILLPCTTLEVFAPTPTGTLMLTGAIAWVDRSANEAFGRPIWHGVRLTARDWPTALTLARFLTELPASAPRSFPASRMTPP